MKKIVLLSIALGCFSIASAQTTKVKTTQTTKAVKGNTTTVQSTETKTKVINRNDITGTDVEVKNNPSSVTATVIQSEKPASEATPATQVITKTQASTNPTPEAKTTSTTTVTTPKQ